MKRSEHVVERYVVEVHGPTRGYALQVETESLNGEEYVRVMYTVSKVSEATVYDKEVNAHILAQRFTADRRQPTSVSRIFVLEPVDAA